MRTFPYQDGDRLIELVEKRELDAYREQAIDKIQAISEAANQQLQDAVERMEQVHIHDLKIEYRKGGTMFGLQCDAIEAVRARLISAALSVTPNADACGQCADKPLPATPTETA
jgi:hypothetical protein